MKKTTILKSLMALSIGFVVLSCNKENTPATPDPTPAPKPQPKEYNRQTDSLALVAIYQASNGPEKWKEDKRWDLTKPMNEWGGITLNEEGRVSVFKLITANTVSSEWELPAAVGDLKELTDLRINSQMLKGQIPAEVYTLSKLKNLYFQNNKLSGSINPAIGNLTELTAIYIDRNTNLEGALPATMGNLTKLENLNISKTGISGAVPAEMVNCAALLNFMAFETKLTSLGDNWDKYPALKIFQFHTSPTLEGPLPASIGNSKTVTSIQLKNCNFTGNIPDSWANLPTSCTMVQVNGNKLSGTLPAAFVANTNYAAKWNAATSILPQQEGYGLTEPSAE